MNKIEILKQVKESPNMKYPLHNDIDPSVRLLINDLIFDGYLEKEIQHNESLRMRNGTSIILTDKGKKALKYKSIERFELYEKIKSYSPNTISIIGVIIIPLLIWLLTTIF